jgi:hypothetical protein
MGSRYTRSLGEPLKIVHNLDDGVDDKLVKTKITDLQGNLITPIFNLTNIGSGIYVNDLFAMVDLPLIIVSYNVLEQDDTTPAGYRNDFDIYEKEDTDKILKDIGINRINVIEAQITSNKDLKVYLKEAELNARVSSKSITASFEKMDDIGAELNDNNITGDINDL